jgi:folate-binding protein YgfZ
MTSFLLNDRDVLRLSGADADNLLQGIITQDMAKLNTHPCLYALQLSPQGKILCDFFLHAQEDGSRLIDIATTFTPLFTQKFTMYRLRSKAQLEPLSGHAVQVSTTGDEAAPFVRSITTQLPADDADTAAFHALRYRHAIPDAAYDAQDDVALDFGADALGGVSFEKGCYVGQEITARMHYRHLMRKALFRVEAAGGLPGAGTPITIGEKAIGTMRGHAGRYGLAMLRLEEAETALRDGLPFLAGETALTLSLPAFLQHKADAFRRAAEKG